MSFTLDQIKEAHSKVKTRADFPEYIQDLGRLGVQSYDTYVSDGHTVYWGAQNFFLQSEAKYPSFEIASKGETERFRHYLEMHQQGRTDYHTFCRHAAETGVEKWRVDLSRMTCTYFSKAGEKMLEENIPVPAGKAG